MSGDLVLLTGATGFVGFRTLLSTLRAGYRVRCAVRSQSGIKKILAAPSLCDLEPSDSQLQWAIVPDFTTVGAFDEAVKGAKYIIHCASPVVKFQPDGGLGREDEIYVEPAVQGVLGMLQSALSHANDTVKRIVVTSSIVAIMPRSCFRGEGLDRPAFTGQSRLPWPIPPYEDPYSASKTAALDASENWIKEHRPSFDLISIMPGWVLGHEELATSTEAILSGSNNALLYFLVGGTRDYPINTGYISVGDLADAHVIALSPSVSGGQSVILSQHLDFEQAREIAKKAFPEAFEKGILSDSGVQPTVSIPTDASDGEKLLGRRFATAEEVVKEVAAQYVKLAQQRS
ncbi:hypothetical protein K4K58_002553 [Colletotrichum sp. SAR11_239]|nr:hypothetical protein K4K58_002553 [Colletotrichum sp. SAR11_239]